MLLQMLDEVSPPPAGAPIDRLASLRVAARAWGARPPPAALLEQLALLAA